MGDINNNSAYAIVAEAYKQAIGSDAMDTIAVENIIETGSDYATLAANKEQFTKALIGLCAKNWFLDESYRSSYKDPFYQDSRRFKNIVQMISIEAPSVQESHAWRSFVSGTSTAGNYTLFLPIIDTVYYGKTSSWELPIAITDEQWDDAVASVEGMEELVDFIMVAIDNAIVQHREDMNNLNRNNFIAEKLTYAESESATGIHKINFVQAYYNERGGNITTADEFRQTPECMRFASKQIALYASYLQRQSTLFNTKEWTKFIPKNKLIIQLNKNFVSDIEEVALSDTFHNEMVALPGYEEVPFWQSLRGDDDTILPGSFDAVTSIDIELNDGITVVTRSGIVGFMAHQYCIMHTIRRERVASTRFDPEAVSQFYYQFRDQYVNNLGMPAIVFTLEDISI